MRPRSLAAAALAGVLAGAAPLSAVQAKPSWKPVYSTRLPGGAMFYDIVFASKSQGWAYGAQGAAGREKPLALHWDGRRWRNTPLPKGMHPVQDIVATSARNAWLLEQPPGRSRVMRWDGRAWKTSKTFPKWGPTDIVALRSGEVWMFGGRYPWRFDGRRWAQVETPARLSVVASRDQRTMLGLSGNGTQVVRYDGRRWHDLPKIDGVQPPSPDEEVYATGFDVVGPREAYLTIVVAELGPPDETGHRPHIAETVKFLRWDGTRWSLAKNLDRADLAYATPDGHGGFYALRTVGRAPQYLYHRSAKGGWKRLLRTPAAYRFDGLAVLPGTSRLFVAGSIDGRSGAVFTRKA